MKAEKTLERTKLPRPLIVVLVLLGLSMFINYIDRGNLSIAAPLLKDELSITPERLGFLLSAFFWTYAILQPIYGWLVDRLNVYWLLAAGFFVWSLATATTGLVHTFIALVLMRFIIGFGEAVCYPSYSKIIALNYPEQHRGIANSVIGAGLTLGPGVGMLLGGSLMARFGWRPFFVVLGFGALAWLPIWIRYMPKHNVAPSSDNRGAPSLLQFIRLRSAWGTCLGLWCANYVNYFVLTWIPYYLVREQHYSMTNMAKVGATAYFASGMSALVFGWWSDRLIVAGASPTRVRKSFTGIGIAACGVLLGLNAVAGPVSCAFCLIAAMVGFGSSASNLWTITQRLAGPHAAGRWTGFQNGFGNLAGVVVPVVTGFALERTGNFHLAFLLVTLVTLFGAACWFFVVGPVEQVEWVGRGAPSIMAPPPTGAGQSAVAD